MDDYPIGASQPADALAAAILARRKLGAGACLALSTPLALVQLARQAPPMPPHFASAYEHEAPRVDELQIPERLPGEALADARRRAFRLQFAKHQARLQARWELLYAEEMLDQLAQVGQGS
jgi:hypothetical protein